MRTDVTTPGTLLQSKALKEAGQKKAMPLIDAKNLTKASNPDYKLDLSTGTKTPSLTLPPAPSVSTPSMPELPRPDVPRSELKDIAKDKALNEGKSKALEIKNEDVKDGSVKKPAIFFIKGLDIFSSPSKSEGGYAGLGQMAESIEGSRLYGWDQKDEIIKDLKKVHRDYPVILVGHSLGGDTAIEIADELDSLKENFRGVDLLITIDAVGFSHDIIPQNVKKHLNVFGENSLFLNDGPHVARREEKTSVRNILSPLDHTDIDDDREIQYEIVDLIQKTLKKN
jgi:hypothetical protein